MCLFSVQPVSVLVSDATLELLTRIRPTGPAEMRQVSGMSEAALEYFQAPLLKVINELKLTAQHLNTAADSDLTTLDRKNRCVDQPLISC